MKLSKVIFIILSVIVLAGCSSDTEKTIFSDQLIYANSNEINLVQIDYKTEKSIQFEDNKVISELVEKLKGIELTKLPVEEEIALFESGEDLYGVALISEFEAVGIAIIFSNGKIVFPDMQTMNDKRTVTYANVKEEKEKLEEIISYIKSLE